MTRRAPWSDPLARYAAQAIPALDLARRHALLLVFLVALTVFALSSRHFTSTTNLLLILMRAAPLGIVVAGQTMVIITGGVDLSVGSVAGLASIVAAKLMREQSAVTLPPIVAIGVALGAALIIGWAHGWLITRRGLPPFIVTFGSMSLIKGLALIYSDAAPIPIPHDTFAWMWRIGSSPRPIPILLMALVFLALAYTLRNTKLGRYSFAIGGNETVARMSGVHVDRYKTQVYMLSSLLAGMAGILLMTRIESGAYTNGENYALISVAAAIIGGASLQGGTGSAWGSLLGVLLLVVVDTGLGALNASLWSTGVIGGLVLLAALADVERRKVREADPPVRMERPPNDHDSYLLQMFGKLQQAIKQQLACEHVRLYMVDREAGDLIQQGRSQDDRTIIGPAQHIARRVEHTRTPIWLEDLSENDTVIVERIKPEMQSAVAVPIHCAGRVVGVLELQSPYTGIFDAATAGQVMELARQYALPLEDAWLLDSGWLLRHTREAFRHLWDEVYLGKCALAGWLYTAENVSETHPAGRGQEVQQLLLSAIDSFCESEIGDHSRARRRYQVLYQTYVEDLTVEEITEKLGISRRQYFYNLKDALEAVVHLIVNREFNAQALPVAVEK
ncbi:MAG: GAF domain-containing protein [Chloroflexi bacterium]|nr:GAF domain-containing protein [Chloroflexota bacterium]